MIKSCEILHTRSAQSHDSFQQISCCHLNPSSATNWSKLEVHFGTFPHVTFEPYIRFSKSWHPCNPWTRPSSTHPMTSISAMIDFPPFWKMSKTRKKFHGSQFLTDCHENWYMASLDRSAQKLWDGCLIFVIVWPWQPIEFGRKDTKQEVSSYLRSPLTYHY